MSVQEHEQLWGGETTKAVANFPVSGERIPVSVVHWLGRIKAAAARVNAELAEDLSEPLRFGVGAHSGATIVGALGLAERSSLQFLGDTGNVASRLEALTKQRGVAAMVSAETLELAGRSGEFGVPERFDVRGRGEIFAVAVSDPAALAGAMRRV